MIPNSTFETSIIMIPFSISSVLLNLIFLKVSLSSSIQDRRAVTDNTLICISAASVLNGIEMFVRSCVAVTDQGNNPDILQGLNSVQFFADSISLWSHFILSVFRFLFVRDIKVPQNHEKRKTQSTVCLKVVAPLIVIISTMNGVLGEVPGTNYVPTLCEVLFAAVKILPFLLTFCVQMISFIKLIYITYSHDLYVQPAGAFPRPSQSMRKFKVYLTVYTMYTICFIVPGLTIYSLEAVFLSKPMTKEERNPITKSYWVVRGLLVLLNPVAFGILSHPRIKFLTSFLDIDKLLCLFRNRHVGIADLPTIPENTHKLEILTNKKELTLSVNSFESDESIVGIASMLPNIRHEGKTHLSQVSLKDNQHPFNAFD